MHNKSPSQYQLYSVRRTNPFVGVIQVIEEENCRSLSLDGINWEIQIQAERPDDLWGAVSQGEVKREYIRFGTWSDAEGLRSVPAHPFLDLTMMRKEATGLIKLIQRHHKEIPFALADRFELWLLDDKDQMPLVLLASKTRLPDDPRRQPRVHWVCSERTGTDFASPECDKGHPPHPKDTNPHPHMSALERLVMIESGHGLTQWFKRLPSGEGIGLGVEHHEKLDNRHLEAEQFPELLIREQWADCYDQALVADYLAWRSPLLLTLQNISDQTRQGLEQQATAYALEVDSLWVLYPKILSDIFLNTARVEAKLRKSCA